MGRFYGVVVHNKTDVHNIKRAFNTESVKRHADDHTSVHIWVEESNALEPQTPVLLQKPHGIEQTAETVSLLPCDFVLCLQTAAQRQFMLQFGTNHMMCLDSTHGIHSPPSSSTAGLHIISWRQMIICTTSLSINNPSAESVAIKQLGDWWPFTQIASRGAKKHVKDYPVLQRHQTDPVWRPSVWTDVASVGQMAKTEVTLSLIRNYYHLDGPPYFITGNVIFLCWFQHASDDQDNNMILTSRTISTHWRHSIPRPAVVNWVSPRLSR